MRKALSAFSTMVVTMAEQRESLSTKVENFVSGIVRFMNRFVRTGALAVTQPWSFNVGLGRLRRAKRIVPPLTFLIVGCFFFSVIIDTYPEGWFVYFNWIWLSEEIGQRIQERGGEMFSLIALVRSGLPTFLAFAVIAQILAWLLARSRWMRPRVFATLCYAFGLHAFAFAIACFLPVIGIYALNPDRSDSFVSNLWINGLSYIVLGLTMIFVLIAVVSPVLLVIWASQRREARLLFKSVGARSLAAIPIFLSSIFIATELGSLPARFTLGLTPTQHLEVQSMAGHRLLGVAPGNVSGATYSMLFHNKTDDLAYINHEDTWVDVIVTSADGSDISPEEEASVRLFDEERLEARLIPIPPGAIQLVFVEISWKLDGSLGEPTQTYSDDGSWWYDGAMLKLYYDLVDGADLEDDLVFELVGLTVHPINP
ncbi:hypothetical protein [Sedimentitalea sp.]|uniref:hypothetical protein n=1 Tax=Sedimentitalea sp. TaxID=2048915 RepID=UPI003297F10D